MSEEDSHATPLNKLPPPIMQTKQGMPPVEMPSYEKLMTEASRPQQDFATQSMMLPPPNAMPPPMQPPMQQYSQPPMPPMQPYPQPPVQQQYPQSYAPEFYPGHYQDAPDKPKPGLAARLLQANRATLIVVAVVFLVLLFVVPRLACMPRFSTPEGQLSVLGKLAASAVAGGAFHVTKMMV